VGQKFRVTFDDGEEMLAEVEESSHVDLDDSVIILRLGASEMEPGYLVHLADIRSLVSPTGHFLYERA